MLQYVKVESSVVKEIRSSAANPTLIDRQFGDLDTLYVVDSRLLSTGNLLVNGISGIGSGNSDLKMTDYASLPGSTYHGSRQPVRNIVLNLVLSVRKPGRGSGVSNRTIENGRHDMELLFPVGREVKLTFYQTDRECFIKGIVESNEPEIWDSSVDGIPYQISIICYDPRFYDVNPTAVTTRSAYQSGFNFPASLTSTSTSGALLSESAFSIDYAGSEEQGMIFTLVFKKAITKIKITRSARVSGDPSPYILLEGASKIVDNGDTLTINTIPGEKSITMKRGATNYNYLNYLDQYNSTWLTLNPGPNAFIIQVDGSKQNNAYTIQVAYHKIYWGI